MHPFKDGKGRSWQIELNCDNVEAVKGRCDVNVLDIEDPKSDLLEQLIAFPPLCCRIVEALVADQLAEKGVPEKDFRQAMNGDAIGDALEGLRSELVNFSPRSRRALLRTVREKQRDVEEKGIELAMARLTDPALVAAAETQMRSALEIEMNRLLGSAASASESSTPATKPPASSASTPDDSPGASSA
jgi:hypothetical protein